MGVKEVAERYHNSGYNCAQSVLCACGKYTGLDEKTALSLSAGFGGGVRCGEVCGAVSGAVMALGCAFPFNDAADVNSKNKIAQLAKSVSSDYKEKYGCLRCVDLKRSGHSCAELIAHGAELAEQIITDNKEE